MFGWVLEKGPINVSTKKWQNPGVYHEKVESVRVSKNCSGGNGKGSNQCEYRKMAKYGWVPGKSRIRASIEKLFGWVLKKWSNQCDYRKMVESVLLPGKGRNCASIEKLFEWVPEKGPISVSTEKWSNPSEYREKVESVQVSKNCSSEYRKRVQSMWVPKNGRIRVSTRKK